MSEIISYRDLVVWQRAMDLAELVYAITDKFPKSEQFGLVRQMRDAAVSIPSNIAEGTRHRTPGYISRVEIALGEHAELETTMFISDRVGYVRAEDKAAFNTLATRVGELAHGLLRSLELRQQQLAAGEAARHLSNKSGKTQRIPNRPQSSGCTNP